MLVRFPFDPIDEKKRGHEQRHEIHHEDQELLKVDMALSFPHVTSKTHNCLTECFENIVREIHPKIDLQYFVLKQ